MMCYDLSMSISRSKRKILFISVIVAVLLIAAGASYFFFVQNRELTREEISKKFECNRITTDIWPTDVFCSRNTTFYNDPENITKEEYAAYLKCEDFPVDTEKTDVQEHDRKRYEICSNPDKLEQKYTDFKEALLELKNNPDSSEFDERLSR